MSEHTTWDLLWAALDTAAIIDDRLRGDGDGLKPSELRELSEVLARTATTWMEHLDATLGGPDRPPPPPGLRLV